MCDNHLLNLQILKKIDSQQMYAVYDKWADIAKENYEQSLDSIDFENLTHIVFTGMGGSGAIGDIFSSILSKTNIHVNVVKGYLLPNTVDSNTLVVSTSVSGNTKETLGVLNAAKKLDCKIIAFSDGGLMKEYCNRNSLQHRQIQMHHSPRASFPAFLYSMLNVLKDTLPIKNEDILESIKKLKLLQTKISSQNLSENNLSLSLAEWIKDIPLIYYPWGLQSVATRFKNSLQENVKHHSMIEDVIETCHNGIVSWEKKSDIQPILIRGQDDHIKTKERWGILKEFLEQNEVEYKEIMSVNGSILTKIINLIYLLDYSTIYKAVLDKVDPSPVKSIDFVKSRLS
jgi:glucose/mannose-6-phosphate isomerase